MDILRKYNLWTEGDFDFGFMRVAYTGRIMDYVGNRLVKVLIGQRRTGKSYVLRQIARELIRNVVHQPGTERLCFLEDSQGFGRVGGAL